MSKYPPGSPEAVENGCECPIIDNGYGKGAYKDPKGNPVYWFSKECPLHGESEEINGKTILVPMSKP